jgi:GGDEF domain-containing protein
MRYSTFEALAATFGTAAVLGTVVAALMGGSGYPEILAQLMLLPILLAALHYGRNGGLLASVLATLIYAALRTPQLADPGLRAPIVWLLVIRAAAYVVIGVMGGELCSRIKYIFLSIEQHDLIDAETGIYAPKHLGKLLAGLIEANRRYGSDFSAALFAIDGDAIPPGRGRNGKRALLKDIAHALRSDVRAVDEVGRRSEYEFLVLLPNTPLAGGNVATGRLDNVVRAHLERRGITAETSFTSRTLGYPDDSEELIGLAESLTGRAFGSRETSAAAPQQA